jgi:UDP-N-acetylglucosamine 1-carboxyvinyltransferase
VKFESKDHTVVVNAEEIKKFEAPYDLVRKMRASFMVAGPLLTRFGKAKVSMPGGCAIGARPVDQHIRGFSALGANIKEEHGYIEATCERLKGNIVYFDRPTHTGTENIIMAGTLADGETTIINAACDPEIVDLANFLNLMGAQVYGAGSTLVKVRGVKELRGIEYKPIGDRLEAGTYLFAAIGTRGDVTVKGVKPQHLAIVLLKMADMGAEVDIKGDTIRVKCDSRPGPVNITTFPYPGFPTDLQPAVMAVLTTARGTSYVRETVFENRFLHVMELMRLGANLEITGDKVIVKGVEELQGAEVMASDIRAGAGLLIACMMAQGESNILRVYHIDRGYERIDAVLNSIGADVKRVEQ